MRLFGSSLAEEFVAFVRKVPPRLDDAGLESPIRLEDVAFVRKLVLADG